jgi:hypothetical protein
MNEAPLKDDLDLKTLSRRLFWFKLRSRIHLRPLLFYASLLFVVTTASSWLLVHYIKHPYSQKTPVPQEEVQWILPGLRDISS